MHDTLLLVIFLYHSITLNIEMNMILQLTRSRGSQECLNFSHALDRCVARKCVPMKFHWASRDVVLVYECHRVTHCSGVATSYAQFSESENICTSVLNRPPIGGSRDNLSHDPALQSCHNEIPYNSPATSLRSRNLAPTVSIIV